jgi:hypothetical protein
MKGRLGDDCCAMRQRRCGQMQPDADRSEQGQGRRVA